MITMQKDVRSSRRQGFVGINIYFLGQVGKQVLKLAVNTRRDRAVPGGEFNQPELVPPGTSEYHSSLGSRSL